MRPPALARAESEEITMLIQYAAVGILFVGAIFFACAALIVSRLLQTHHPYKEKCQTYECGMPPIGGAWVRFKPSYFQTGLIFLLFDVEMMFLLPWAAAFRGMGLAALLEMFVFITILTVGLIYAWKERVLEWH